MKLYGLTGGPGMGKSEAAKILAQQDIPVVDTDDLARDVVQPGQPGLAAVAREFGAAVSPSGELDRAALAKIVFSDPPARQRLEQLLHPLIRERWMARADEWRQRGVAAGVVVIPLLFETGAQQEFESVICIACTAQLQSARLQARGWSAGQMAGRLAAQWPIDAKIDRADFVVWNDADFSVLREQLGRVPPLKGGR